MWLYGIAAMTFAVLVVGGITRLTHSGLSMVEWEPIVGIVPPLNEAQWREAFDAYRRFPEYQQLRRGMTLGEFKFIFFWEYLHRVLARAIGIVFLVPFVYFWVKRYFNPPLLWRTLGLFALGGLQGAMGWFMVASGLVDRPSVSHYRLAAHLSLAFLIFGAALWIARSVGPGEKAAAPTLARGTRRMLRQGLIAVGLLLGLQIVWGALVAGLRAGFLLNTFPLMAGRLVPPGLLMLDPAALNFVENPAAVQWTHRALGTLLAVAVLAFWWIVQRSDADAVSRRLNHWLAGLVLAQYGLGVLTLLLVVPVSIAVAHQAVALLLFGCWVLWLQHVAGQPHTRGTQV